jgi:hypothetical protein
MIGGLNPTLTVALPPLRARPCPLCGCRVFRFTRMPLSQDLEACERPAPDFVELAGLTNGQQYRFTVSTASSSGHSRGAHTAQCRPRALAYVNHLMACGVGTGRQSEAAAGGGGWDVTGRVGPGSGNGHAGYADYRSLPRHTPAGWVADPAGRTIWDRSPRDSSSQRCGECMRARMGEVYPPEGARKGAWEVWTQEALEAQEAQEAQEAGADAAGSVSGARGRTAHRTAHRGAVRFRRESPPPPSHFFVPQWQRFLLQWPAPASPREACPATRQAPPRRQGGAAPAASDGSASDGSAFPAFHPAVIIRTEEGDLQQLFRMLKPYFAQVRPLTPLPL